MAENSFAFLEELVEAQRSWANFKGISPWKQASRWKASKLWTKSTFIKTLCHWVTGDRKLAARQSVWLNCERVILEKRQRGGLAGSGLGTELLEPSEERGGFSPHFLDWSHQEELSEINALSVSRWRDRQGQKHLLLSVSLQEMLFPLVVTESERRSRWLQWNKMAAPQLKCFPWGAAELGLLFPSAAFLRSTKLAWAPALGQVLPTSRFSLWAVVL